MYVVLKGQNKKGESWGFERFGDIWSGVIFKKIADHLGYAIASGYPIIWHAKASNVFTNLKKEASGIKINETFWEIIDTIELPDVASGCETIGIAAVGLPLIPKPGESERAMRIWA